MPASTPHAAEAARDVPGLLQLASRCRLCPDVTPPPVLWASPGQRALLVGQAPGAAELGIALPFQGRAGRTLRGWLAPLGVGSDEDFRRLFAICATALCFPGPSPGGRGDRAPSRVERERCRPWSTALLRLLEPTLIVPVGRLAIDDWVGRAPLTEVVGRRFERDGRAVVPLPHPSGASAWTNDPANRALVARAVELVAAAHPALVGQAR